MGRLWPSEKMEAVVNKTRYRMAGSTLLAHDSFWDGHNFERHGRNTFLYRSPRGRYFAVHLTMWQGERDYIEPLSEDEAYKLYEDLPEHETPVEQAFPNVRIEEG